MSVWQRAFAIIFSLTSPALGAATVTISTFKGSLGAQHTAALHWIGAGAVNEAIFRGVGMRFGLEILRIIIIDQLM